MFWFYFMFCLRVLMLSADVALWVLLLRWANKQPWRALLHVFFATQVIAHLSLMSGLDWTRHTPQVLLVIVLAWHYLAVAVALGVLMPLGVARFIRARRNSREQTTPDAATIEDTALDRRAFIAACAALAPPVFTFSLTGLAEANLAALRVRRFTLQFPTLPQALDGMTIAHVSDLHVGGLTSERVLRQMVEKTNALRPDLVLLTGDIINRQLMDLPAALGLVNAMRGRYGCCMIEGNHDLFEDGEEFARQVRAAGVPLLVDQSLVTTVRGYPVQLLGLGWLRARRREIDRLMVLQLRALMPQRQPDAFPILLAHHPHVFDAAAKVDLPLTLAGHTHGGYWMLNEQTGVGSAAFRYWSGLYTRGRSNLIVSNGIGNWPGLPPARINAPAEVIHLTLRCA